MNQSARDVVILGGGVSGLTAAWRLKQAGVDVCLLEARNSVGGCARTESREGFLLEKGPFNVMVRHQAFETLLGELSGRVKVVTAAPTARARYIYRNGCLHLVPTHPGGLVTTGLLSPAGKGRLLAGLIASRRPGACEETIEQTAIRRFGRQVCDTIISAVVAGILAGDIRRLSTKACFPSVWRVDTRARSPLGFGLVAALKKMPHRNGKAKRRWGGLISMDRGLGALTAALGRRLGTDLFCSCRALGIRPLMVNGSATGYEVDYADGGGKARTIRCRRVVIASPATAACRLLRPLVPDGAAILKGIESASLVVLNLGFCGTDIGHPMKGFGFLVPHNEPEFPLLGCLWADSIFPHHAPSGHRLIRVFIGGTRDPLAAQRTDEELLATAMDALRSLLDIHASPVLIDLCRHEAAVPQYHIGHCEKIERLRAAVSQLPGLYLIGNYLEGVSVNDCIRLATGVANHLIRSTAAKEPVQAPR